MLNKPVECIEFIECDDEWQLNRECAEWKSYSVSLEEPFAAPPFWQDTHDAADPEWLLKDKRNTYLIILL